MMGRGVAGIRVLAVIVVLGVPTGAMARDRWVSLHGGAAFGAALGDNANTGFALALTAHEELGPTAEIDIALGVMKQFSGSECLVAGLSKTHLQRPQIGAAVKKGRCVVVAGGGCVLSGKDGRA